MATTKPIKRTKDIQSLKDYFLFEKPDIRNYALVVFGLNSALRISDILAIKWKDIFDFDTNTLKEHLHLNESKTKKVQVVKLNDNLRQAVSLLYDASPYKEPDEYIFYGRYGGEDHLSRSQAYRIINKASKNLGIGEHISCHSLRKTFGYHAWRSGISPVIIMAIYNHSSFDITKRYLGIEQEDKDSVFSNLNL